MAYCKIHLYADLLESDLPEDRYLRHDLERYFAAPLPERYPAEMQSHRLHREIIATVVANQLVDRAGTTFAFRLGEETGAPASILARAYAVAREVFGMRTYWEQIEQLDSEVDAKIQLEMLIEGRRLVERATRWLARANPRQIDIEVTVRFFEPGAKTLSKSLPDVLDSSDRWKYATRVDELGEAGVPAELAERVAAMPWMLPTFDVVEVARATEWPLGAVMETYFRIGSGIELNWLRDRIIELPRANRWQALARAALRDDLSSLHRALTHEVLQAGGRDANADVAIERWQSAHAAAIERTTAILDDIKGSRTYDTTTLPVALREIRNLIRGGVANEGVPGAESVTMAG